MQSNVELIQQAFDEFGKRNFQAVADRCTNDVVWGSFDNPAVPFAGIYKGRDGVLKFFKALNEHVDYARFEPQEFYAQGDTVVVRGYHSAKAKDTGKTFGHEWAMFFKIRDAKVASYFCFVDTRDQAQAFEAPQSGQPEHRFERPGESIPEPAKAGAPRRST